MARLTRSFLQLWRERSHELASISNPLHEALDHFLHAGLFEVDREFGAVDFGDAAVAEFVVEDALAGFEAAAGGGV